MPRIRSRIAGDLFRSPRAENLPSLIAAFRHQINHIIRRLDHIGVMLDNQHAMASINEPIETIQQPLNIRQVQSRRWLV